MQERVAVDVLLGAASVGAGAVRAVTAPVVLVVRGGVVRSRRLWPGPTPDLSALGERGKHVRVDLERLAARVLHEVVRRVVGVVLEVVDLTDVVRRNVDVDAIVRDVDLEAVVHRVDVDGVVARVDVEAVVARVDLDELVAKVDLDAVASRVDVDSVASRLDLGRVIARLNLDEVAKRLDVDAVVARVDLDAVLGRLDLPGIAMKVVTAIDLPEMVREATGPAASEVVRGIRTEGAQADDVVARMVDRLLHRGRSDRPEAGRQQT